MTLSHDDQPGAVRARELARTQDHPDAGRVHERQPAQIEHEPTAGPQVEPQHPLVGVAGARCVELALEGEHDLRPSRE
jgi:hypothetical protein